MSSNQDVEDLIESESGEAVSALVQDRCSQALSLWLWLKVPLRRARGIAEQARTRSFVI